VWAVCPAFEESGPLREVLPALLDVVDHIIVVDDGSTDGTKEAVRSFSVWCIRHPVNLGQGAALQTGFDFALSQGAEYIVTFDADGQHDARDVRHLLTGLKQQRADFALGSRFLGEAEDIPWVRKVILKGGVVFTRLLSGVKLTDTHNGIRAMTRRGAETIRITMNRMEHASEILDQIVASGLKYIEVPVRVVYTEESLKKGQSSAAAFKLAVKLIVEKLAR
jgi:glycosyltransferase involved in cell wall biosynthesis